MILPSPLARAAITFLSAWNACRNNVVDLISRKKKKKDEVGLVERKRS